MTTKPTPPRAKAPAQLWGFYVLRTDNWKWELAPFLRREAAMKSSESWNRIGITCGKVFRIPHTALPPKPKGK